MIVSEAEHIPTRVVAGLFALIYALSMVWFMESMDLISKTAGWAVTVVLATSALLSNSAYTIKSKPFLLMFFGLGIVAGIADMYGPLTVSYGPDYIAALLKAIPLIIFYAFAKRAFLSGGDNA